MRTVQASPCEGEVARRAGEVEYQKRNHPRVVPFLIFDLSGPSGHLPFTRGGLDGAHSKASPS